MEQKLQQQKKRLIQSSKAWINQNGNKRSLLQKLNSKLQQQVQQNQKESQVQEEKIEQNLVEKTDQVKMFQERFKSLMNNQSNKDVLQEKLIRTSVPVVPPSSKQENKTNIGIIQYFKKLRTQKIEREKIHKQNPKSTMELLIRDEEQRQVDLIQKFVQKYKQDILFKKKDLLRQNEERIQFVNDGDDIWDEIELEDSKIIEKEEIMSILMNNYNQDLLSNDQGGPAQIMDKYRESNIYPEENQIDISYQNLQSQNDLKLNQSLIAAPIGINQLTKQHTKIVVLDEMPILKQSQTIIQDISHLLLKNFQVDYKKEIEAQDKFNKRYDFLQLIKHSENSANNLDLTDQEKVQIEFINHCIQKKVLPLPLVGKIQTMGLQLKNYHLTKDICTSLSVLIDQTQINFLIHALFRNLEILELISCKTSAIPIEMILKNLQNRCFLKTLKIINLDLSQNNLDQFVDIILNQQFIHKLDISQNDFPQKVDSITNQTRVNMNIIHLDLSSTNLMNDEFMLISNAMKRSKSLLKNSMDMSQKEDDCPRQESAYKQQQSKNNLQLKRDSSLVNNSLVQSLMGFPKNGEKIKLKEKPKFNNTMSKGRYFSMPKDQIIFFRFLGHSEIKDSYKWNVDKYCPVCEKWQNLIFIYSQKIDPLDVQAVQTQIQKETQHKKQDFKKNLIPHNTIKDIIESFKLDVRVSGSPCFTYQKNQEFLSLEDFIDKLEDNMEAHYQFGERLISSDDHDIQHRKVRKQNKLKVKELNLKEKQRELEFLSHSYKRFRKIEDAHNFMDSLQARSQLLDDEVALLSYKDLDWKRNQKLYEKLRKLCKDQNPIILSNKFINDGKNVDLAKLKSETLDKQNFQIDEEIYVYSVIVPPGFHQIKISSQRKFYSKISEEDQNQQEFPSTPQKIVNTYSLTLDVPKRQSDLNVFYKKKKKRRLNRYFNKDKSCFRYWRSDDEVLIGEMLNNDFKKMKYARMVRDAKDITSRSAYPNISWLDFSYFCFDFNIPDKFCTISKIDMAFIATNVELERNDDNPDRDLNRSEFFEILLRLANEKFKKSGQTDKFSVALRRLCKENLSAMFHPVMHYQDWREKVLWNLDVDDVFKVNSAAIRRLFNMSQTQSVLKRYWNMQDCVYLICNNCPFFNIPENNVKLAYAFSKMTVVDEESESHKYQRMVYVEFLEFIGRIAYLVKIPENIQKEIILRLPEEKSEIGFLEKLEYTLDKLLALVACKRKPTESLKDQYDTDSDYD
eukprot:403352766